MISKRDHHHKIAQAATLEAPAIDCDAVHWNVKVEVTLLESSSATAYYWALESPDMSHPESKRVLKAPNICPWPAGQPKHVLFLQGDD